MAVALLEAVPPAVARHPLTEADAVDIWIARWLRIRRKDLVNRYGCDPRRLYEIWEGARFPEARPKALEVFARRGAIPASWIGSTSGHTSAMCVPLTPTSYLCSRSCRCGLDTSERGENKRWTNSMIRAMFSLRSQPQMQRNPGLVSRLPP